MEIITSKIPLPNGVEIVAQRYDYDGEHPEIAICLWKDGVAVQYLCLVRPFEEDKTNAEVLVWGDECDEDYTHKFVIKPYKEEE